LRPEARELRDIEKTEEKESGFEIWLFIGLVFWNYERSPLRNDKLVREL
jgi:hypothetical protein